MTFVPNPTGIRLLFTNPTGGIARELERIGDRVVDVTKVNLSQPYDRRSLNPPPGPPRLRTGDLQQSVRREDARVFGDVLVVECVAPAVHRGWYYDQELRRRGYEFVDLNQI